MPPNTLLWSHSDKQRRERAARRPHVERGES